MPGGNVKKKEIEPVGPFSAPLPKDAENSVGEPMAVARDKDTPHDAAMPTSASTEDPMNRELAAKYRVSKSGQDAIQESFQVGGRVDAGGAGAAAEATRQKNPSGYVDAGASGFKKLDADEDEA